MQDPTDALAPTLRDAVRRILQRQVAGGSARFQHDGDRSGMDGQKAISQLLKGAGLTEANPLWQSVNKYGKDLYYGKTPRAAPQVQQAPVKAARAVPAASMDAGEGPVYTSGSTFRARAEAHQRRFRSEVLRAGHAKWGHVLDEHATNAGENFHHRAARTAAEARAAAGKGVNRERTFGNMLSSQALCFNLMGPLAADAEGRRLAAEVLGPFVPGLASVRLIEIEHTPPAEIFGDQSGFAGVDCDVLVHFDDAFGAPGVLVLETKFVEPGFSTCGHRSKSSADACPQDVRLGEEAAGCRYVQRNRFRYWQRAAETRSLNLRPEATSGCPFGGPLWQIWVNHTLAHALAARSRAKRAVFAVCAPAENDVLLQGGAVLDEFRRCAADPSTVVFIPLEAILERLVTVTAGRADWEGWAATLQRRYVIPGVGAGVGDAARVAASVPARVPTPIPGSGRVTTGQRQVVAFMATQAFRDTVVAHREACGARSAVYFRPTDKGLVRIALHPEAPGYVGLRTGGDDDGFVLRVGMPLPSVPEIVERLAAFESWVPSMKRRSHEERGVIPWVRRALESGLSLPELGPGWVFLHQEWRFVDERGQSRKSDVLAVHLPTGRLGIVEFKSAEAALGEAGFQVRAYGGDWQRDAAELATLFTDLLRAMGAAYGNGEAARATVSTSEAVLFVGVAAPDRRVTIRQV